MKQATDSDNARYRRLKGHARIQQAMRDNERWVLEKIYRAGRWQPMLLAMPEWNAIDRLKARGMIKFDHGYVLAKKWKPTPK